MDDPTAGVDDQRLRRQQRLDLGKPQPSLLAARDQPRRWSVEDAGQTFDFGEQRRNAGLARSARLSAADAALIRKRRMARPATTSSWPAREAGGSGVGSKSASSRSTSSRRPISSR